MRQEIRDFIALGPLPDEQADEERIKQHEDALARITEPVTDEEAKALVASFGPDDSYGLAWSLVHLIETAPNWPLKEALEGVESEWVRRLRSRAESRR